MLASRQAPVERPRLRNRGETREEGFGFARYAALAGLIAGHYLRTSNPVNPESLAAYGRRLPSNRSNPYLEPGGYAKLPGGLEVFGGYLCRSGAIPQLVPTFTGDFANVINEFVYGGTTNAGVAPPCKEQAPLGRTAGQPGRYPRLDGLPPGSR